MTTKDQERKALEQIRKIVDGLGEHSFVGTAMEGVLYAAEHNIEYLEETSLEEANKTINALERKVSDMEAERVGLMNTISTLKSVLNTRNDSIRQNNNEEYELNARIAELEAAQAKLEHENMKLKAKLYDMMTA